MKRQRKPVCRDRVNADSVYGDGGDTDVVCRDGGDADVVYRDRGDVDMVCRDGGDVDDVCRDRDDADADREAWGGSCMFHAWYMSLVMVSDAYY
jgi:hypothetical protein